jgi:hypothetical protein
MRRVLFVVLAALTLMGLLTAAAPAGSAKATASARPVTVSVSATDWTNTGVTVTAGEVLRITATGTWTDGSTTSGPNGSAKPWPDNFFNLADLGACADCATTDVPNWGALIGYVGGSPPASGSYTSTAVRPQALRVFYVGGNYEAEVLHNGPLWLYKNADAYSGYTVDNSGHVTARITVLPSESPSQVAARARVAALSASAAAPLQQAWNSCAQAVWNAAESPQMLAVLLALLIPWVPEAELAVVGIEGLTLVAGTFEIFYNVSDGSLEEATVDSGQFILELEAHIAEIPLFGVVGAPAIDCVLAGFWLSGQLGGQLGAILRKKFITKADVTSSVAGTWTLSRSTISCVHLASCNDDPMILKFTDCKRTQCTLTRLRYTWRKSHPIVLKNGIWTASFTDISATCGSQDNPANITLTLRVTSYKSGLADVAQTLGGTYAVSAAANPPNCTPNISSLQDLFGGRS